MARLRLNPLELPLVRQLRGDPLALGRAARSPVSERLTARTKTADKVVRSICPYCAVGCGQRVFVEDERVVQIEGDPDSPISRGRLCPKGAASLQLTTHDRRELTVKYRRPHGSGWETLPLEQAMDMIADRLIKTREDTWEAHAEGKPEARLNRTLGFAHLGGATLDNEENYLIKKRDRGDHPLRGSSARVVRRAEDGIYAPAHDGSGRPVPAADETIAR